MESVTSIANKIFANVVNPIIVLLFALAMLYFFWGIVKFIKNVNSEDDRETGKRAMVWGIVGMAIMFSVFGITGFIINTLQIEDTEGIPQSLKR